jgi:predicted nucleotidyltransferase
MHVKKRLMKNNEDIIKSIKALHGELKAYKVREIGVFGSVVRGEQKHASDIDVLVDFEDNADLFDLVGLGSFLEEKLGQKVDVVPRRALRQEIRDFVLKEVVPA